jgi:hypothetical protein
MSSSNTCPEAEVEGMASFIGYIHKGSDSTKLNYLSAREVGTVD